MPRRAKGSGGVVQRPDGRWMAQVSMGFVDGKRVRRTFYGWSHDEVEAKMRDAFPDLKAHDAPSIPRVERMREARALGTHTNQEWIRLLIETDRTCHYCGDRPFRGVTKDHRTPVTRGGSDAIDNIVPACKPCNYAKGTLTDVEFMAIGGRDRG